jgi:hypothetical protein
MKHLRMLTIILALLICSVSYGAEMERVEISTVGAPSIGEAGAQVTIIEFIDYQ